jgi:PIN domain nuclease of toxin-antitoxin system
VTHVVDTHALVWFLEGSNQLSEPARAALADPSVQIVIPAIVLAEITFLRAKGRIQTDRATVLQRIASSANAIIYPLDESVVEHLPTTLDIHDAIIVATALVFRDLLHEPTAVITKDRAITASSLVNTIW